MKISKNKSCQTISWAVGDGPLQRGTLCCVIGNFDGVHKGHQALIAAAGERAAASALPLAVITFSPHPRRYFDPAGPAFLLTGRDLKHRLLGAQGVDIIIDVSFNQELQLMGPERFVEDVLIKAFNAGHLFAGADFAFGKGRAGSMESLHVAGQPLGLAVHSVDLVGDDNKAAVSSSLIRQALAKGDVKTAEHLSGRPPIIAGTVIMGDQRGRQLAFPTANIELGDVMAPALGVYAVEAEITAQDGSVRRAIGVANIGRRPTVNDRGLLAEAHLFDFDADIYGAQMLLFLKAFIRPERKFDGLDALKAQIARDVKSAAQILATRD